MSYKIALAGNPNCGKTTLFNALTGANQYVGNWPGVTVEKKEGKLKHYKDVEVIDLPGIYSLSPYTLEEVVARNYLVNERPDAIINIIDGTNIERNLYLSTQLIELGIPVVMAVNMMDIVAKNGDVINVKILSEKIGCEVFEISALKGTGIKEVCDKAIEAAQAKKAVKRVHSFDGAVEEAINKVEDKLSISVAEEQKRFLAIKLLESDSKIQDLLKDVPNVDAEIKALEDKFDDDVESIITSERYEYITSIIGSCVTKKERRNNLTTSDKIDKIVTNRILALPIFAIVMFLVYYIAMSTIGAWCTDWTNDNLFGDGFHLFGIGASDYEEQADDYTAAYQALDAYGVLVLDEDEAVDADATAFAIKGLDFNGTVVSYTLEDEETLEEYDINVFYSEIPEDADEEETNAMTYLEAVAFFNEKGLEEPDPADYGVFVPSIPDLVASGLDAIDCAEWLQGLIIDGIIAGVGAVLGFVPQMLVLFILLAFLEYCGYMARVAFILDRVFRKFGLSGKSFIPYLVGMGCGVPGIMASRTIENEKDRRMTIITTTFIPCGAKLPFISMVAGALLGGNPLVSTSAYFIGICSVIVSGIMLKKTKAFAGDPAPFVMELPAYHWPTIGSVLRSMWERGWSFIKKAGTIIMLSTIVIWFTTYFGWVDGAFRMLTEDEIDFSILGRVGSAIAWIFVPQGWGNWQATVASITGLVAKENIVGTMGILYGGEGHAWAAMADAFTSNGAMAAAGYSFLIFNLLCAPCFAAMGAIKREMNSKKWFWIAVGYQCGFAYVISLITYRIAGLITGECIFGVWSVVAILLIVGLIYLLFRKDRYKNRTVA